MAKIVFITGGAASGKSRWAVSSFASCDNVLYMVIADKIDDDTAARIDFNCKKNDVEWEIKTSVHNINEVAGGRKFTIFDNLGAYTNIVIKRICPNLDDMTDDIRRTIERQTISDVTELIDMAKDGNGNLLIISTELGFGPLPENQSQRWFREIIGNVNQRIANISTEVYLSASGIPFKIKG
ncbi:MAG: bifunctional adenosylcobinamide kinase/adenosylcobinamide-phosphate guanylyltransferase [Oscillospiraceae bacterium]|nr:bifunctional adenosylcobinamide kinase/adenosylcobinamide-phosphate guanylyltransferase [Oscillospiraceae bacterium]